MNANEPLRYGRFASLLIRVHSRLSRANSLQPDAETLGDFRCVAAMPTSFSVRRSLGRRPLRPSGPCRPNAECLSVLGAPRQHCVGRVEDEVELALDGFQSRVFAGRKELVGSLLAGVVFLGSASRDRGDLASPSVQKLQRDVIEPADADHAHSCGRRGHSRPRLSSLQAAPWLLSSYRRTLVGVKYHARRFCTQLLNRLPTHWSFTMFFSAARSLQESIASLPLVVSFVLFSSDCFSDSFLQAQEMIQPNGPVELIRDGFEFLEGPAYDPQSDMLYFSDIPANKIYTLNASGEFGVFTDDSRHTNGIVYVSGGKFAGKLAACQMDGQLVVYDPKTKDFEALAAEYGNARFNAPNDLVVDAQGGTYFTDPLFRAPQPLPQEIQAVYYRAADGTVTRLTENLAAPNGVALSPDGKRLYVIPSQQADMLVYEISGPGKIGEAKVFCSLKQPEGKTQTGGDGTVVDVEGNLYITSNLGVQIFSPEGEYRGLVQSGQQPANVTFGGEDLKTLYITARTGLYRVQMPIAGLKPN